MNVYQVIKENPNGLIKILEKHNESNSEEYYYETRALDRTSDYDKLSNEEKAGRRLYLNKTCYNGCFNFFNAVFFLKIFVSRCLASFRPVPGS